MDFSLHTRAIGAFPSPTQQHSHVFVSSGVFKASKGVCAQIFFPDFFLFQQSNENGMAKMLNILFNNLK